MAFLFVEAGIMNGFLLHHVRGHYRNGRRC